MIVANLACGPVGHEENLGDHQFLALPRVNERITLHVDGEFIHLMVDDVFHRPAPIEGGGTAYVTLRVQRR